MPLPILNILDFTGTAQLQIDTQTETKFDVIRDERENSYIYELLGAELGGLFIADLDINGVPVTARFLDIYNAFAEDITTGVYPDWCNGAVVESKGIKYFLLNIVWFYFARNNQMLVTAGGNMSAASQNSTPNNDSFALVRMYNKSIDTGKAIQWSICENSATYPEFNGQYLNYNIPS
jgi:hypothetical protein